MYFSLFFKINKERITIVISENKQINMAVIHLSTKDGLTNNKRIETQKIINNVDINQKRLMKLVCLFFQ